MAGKIILKITLRNVKPPVWRRIEVPSSFTFRELYLCIQAAMGWMNCHLSEFHVNGKTVTQPSFEPEGDFIDSRTAKLLALLKEGSKFEYWYDFGDDWYHDLVVEKIDPAAELSKPVCTGGARACPPEDCGGPYGYSELLQALANPKHPQHKELKEWVGGRFDAGKFDLKEANSLLKDYEEMEEEH